MKKIIIIGSGGSGKSTLAKRLSEITKIKVIHLDAEYWKPGWEKPEKKEWIEKQKNIVSQEQWIIDGNYDSTLDIRIDGADTIIFLDFSRIRCVYQAIKRWLKYRGQPRPDMGKGCDEKLDWDFIKWIWNYNKDNKPMVLEKLNKYLKTKNIIILKDLKEVNKFLGNISKQ